MIPALSLSQPWADHVVYLDKLIENRSWWTKHRGPMLLHAAKSIDDGAPDSPTTPNLRGYLTGICRVIDCLPLAKAEARYPDQVAKQFVFGPWCWVLEDRRPLPIAVPVRGMPSLFLPVIKDEAQLAQLEEFLTRGGYQ
jgi:hypothetical protein